MTEPTRVAPPNLEPAALDRWRRRLRIAQGREPADLVLRGGHVVNVFSGELERLDVAIADGVICALGRSLDGLAIDDVTGAVIAPSFIDAHIHIESSLLWVPEFARAVVPHGTGAVVTDPHEIANVAGLAGIRAFRDASRDLPLHIRFTVPSCVPASEHESPGATLDVEEMREALAWPESVGLGEMMNFPGLLAGDAAIFAKLGAAGSLRRDGHAPGLRGLQAAAYAGAGLHSDHESTSLDEAREKLRAGLMIMIREGSTEHNLHELLLLVGDATYPRFCFASDDRDCHTLHERGHVDDILRAAITAGLDPLRAIRMATWNAADYWRLDGIGAVAPRYDANLVVLDDLQGIRVETTYFQGRVAARRGAFVGAAAASPPPALFSNTVRVAPVMLRDLALLPDDAKFAVDVIPGQIVTRVLEVEPTVESGQAVSDPARDLLKLVCVERHAASGRIGVGYVRGFGLRKGAMASTIAHDAHNIVAVGVDDVDILGAIAAVADSQGGLAVVAEGRVVRHLPLPIAGLLSDRPLAEVAAGYAELEDAARSLGCALPSPFGLLAFMALSVIPEARVTDRGFLKL
ncbi:MAG: adenine deaminase [Thermomicrobiales bacterium]